MRKTTAFIKYTFKMVVNKIVIKSILLSTIAVSWACASSTNDKGKEKIAERRTVQNILSCARFDKQCNLKPFVFQERAGMNEENLSRDVELLHHLIKTYYYPDINEWAIEYDTLNSIVKYSNVIVLFRNSKADTSIVAKATFSFDYTKKYLPDTIVSVFNIELFKELNFRYESDTMATIEIGQ